MTRPLGDKMSDSVAKIMGSWGFVLGQAIFLAIWFIINTVSLFYRFDPYPFILANLFMSAEAAFATPLLLMSQNKASAQDRNTITEDKNIDNESLEILKWMKEKLSDVPD